MKKPKPIKIECLDYHQCKEFLEEKYDIKLRDYAGKYDGNPDAPYLDFWHHVINDVFYGDIYNQCVKEIDPEYAKERAPENWQKEIWDLWIKEFKEYMNETGSLKFYFFW